MPRRKGHGISPTKRATQSKDEVQIKKKAADNNEDPGGGEEEGTATTRVTIVAPATNDVNNKYLHKKFKKMATTSSPPPPSQSPPTPMVNGEARDISSVPPSSSSSSCSSPPSVPQGRYVCPYCKLACAKPSVLQKHVRAHTNERPFPCHPCGFAFKTKSNLYKHCRSRAHALKMEEEGGTKLNIPFAESSDDLEEEPEDTSSNSTPPPAPVISTPAATTTTTTMSQERPRQIYKPKFHKAALYQEEEQQQQQQSATAASLSTATKSTTFPSPEFLQRHISKIINDNDEIVGPKKFLHREQLREDSPASPLSSSSSPGVDPAVLWPKKLYQRQLSVGGEQSKLANALLRPAPSPVDMQPLNLSKPERRRYNSEGTGSLTVLKDHNSTNNQRPQPNPKLDGAPSLLKNANDKLPIHPQNPEGSIIKDLLLRQRGGLAVSASGVPVTLEMLNYVEDPQFVCSMCKIPYRSAENLETHQRYYCKGEGSLKSYSPQHSPLLYRAPEEGARAPQPLKPPNKIKCPPTTSPIHVVPPFPSPGPHLGNTPLVDTTAYHTARHDDLAEEHPRRKRARLESEHSRDSSGTSSPSTTPIPGIISPSAATLKTLEELSKFPMRTNSNSNSLPPFGGEVQILDGAGEKKTMRIESSSCGVKSPCSTSDIIFGMPNHVLISSAVSKSALADLDDDSSSGTVSPHHCTTIAKGLHSGGTIMQVPQKSSNNLETPGSVRSPRTPSLSSHSPKSPLPKPTQKNSIGASGGVMLNPSPAPSPYSTTVFLTSSDTATMTTSFPDTTKLLVPIVPNIAAPNLAVPGIPMPQNVQFISIASVLPEVLNPLTSITAYNPLTLPPHSGIHPMPTLRLSQPPVKEKKTSPVAVMPAPFIREVNLPAPTYSGGVGTIYEDGKPIPYVPGMPGPHSLVSTIPPPLPRRKEASPKPLDLASPSREPHHQMSTDPHSGMFFPRNFKPLNLVEAVPQELTAAPRGPPVPPKLKEQNIPRIKVDSAAMNSETPISDQPVRKISRPEILTIEVDKDEEKEAESIKLRKPEISEANEEPQNKNKPKFLRPTTLPLKPGTFTPKKHHGVGLTPTGTVLSLISPETPRPKKSYGQLYLNGHAYTYLGLKCSTRTFYCALTKPQPMYVPQSSEHPKLSMYSNWKICKETDPNPFGLDPGQAMALYDSRHRPATYTIAKTPQNQPMVLTHSSYWLEKMSKAQQSEKAKKEKNTVSESNQGDSATKPDSNETTTSSSDTPPKRVKIFDGGFESNEDYIYVRGRGRGRYVCEECGIRCKKPSMLKKHIRTHTDVRPFTCKHCNFSFKTKGNLTKHMKSKAHYKKCMELGIDPVPTVVDDSYIDEECLARQQALRASQRAEGESESDENEEEEEDEEEEEEEEDEEPNQGTEDGDDTGSMKGKLEREAACSLLSLSESTRVNSSSSQYASAGLIPLTSHCGRPTTYPYNLTMPVLCQGNSFSAPQTPTLTAVSAQMEHEKVSHNTGLALELRGSGDGKMKDDDSRLSSTLRRRNNAALVLIPPQQGDANRYYFPSCRTPTIVTNVPVSSYAKSLSGDKSSLDGGSDSEYDRDTSSAAYSDDDDKDMSDGSAKREKNVIMELGAPASQQPMDLSNKSVSTPTRKISSTMFPYFPPSSGARTPTTPISEILTPVSEPATLLASLCSSVERFPVPTHKVPDPSETTMLQAYLTERALQDARIKQHQQFHNHHGYNKGSSSLQDKPPSTTKKNVAPQKEIPPHRPVPLKIPQPITEAQKLKVSEALVHDCSSPRLEIPVSETVPEKPPPVKPKDTLGAKLQGGLVPMSNNNIVRNVVVSGIGFTSHQPSSPPTSTTGTTTMAKNSSSGKLKAEFLPPSSGPSASYVSMTEDGRSICVICNKIFSKPSQLRLHVNIHYFERPFRCESCAVSFRTKGHLQKHERSVSHQNKVSMNSTFGTPTTTNPRPFKCDDCKIAFRIHGHLAKHLRSKMHIMKLECVGKLPFGTYAEMEREGISLNEIDTTDCDNSLESLQVLAQRLYEKDPSKLGQWDGERVDMLQSHPVPHMSGGETSSDEGEPLLGCQSPPANMVQQRESADVTFGQQDDLSASKKRVSETDLQHGASDWSNSMTKLESCKRVFVNDVTTNGSSCQQNSVHSEEGDYEDTSDGDNELNGNSHPKFSCSQCPQVFTSMGALHVHSFVEHDSGAETTDEGSAQCTRSTMDSELIIPSHFRKRPKDFSSYEDPSLFGSATKRPTFEQHVKTSGGYLTLMCGVNSDEQAGNECRETIAQGADSERVRNSPISSGESAKCDVSASSRQYADSDAGNPQAKLNCDLQAAVQSGQESYRKELQSTAQIRTAMHNFSSAGFVMQQSSSSEPSQQQGKD